MGVIGRPHGVRGLVHVVSYAEGDLASYAPLRDDQGRAWTLAWRGAHTPDGGVAELRDPQGRPLASRDDAQRLTNQRLYVRRDQLPEPDDEDDFYRADLLGLEAHDPAGAAIGRVAALHDYGAGLSLELDTGRLVPFTRACVPAIDLEAGRLTVDLPAEVEVPLP